MARTHLASWLSSPDSAAEFEAAVLPLREKLRRLALRLTQSPESAEDLVQETLLRAFQRFGRFRRGTNLWAWLMRILLNLFISHYRQQQRSVPTVSLEGLLEEMELAEEEASLLTDPAAISPEDALLAQVLDEEVERALAQLPDVFREVVILCDLQGFSYAEAAQQLGVPIGTIRSRLSRGREILRRLLWDYARKRRWV
ncbi:MAG: hypothetical protein KEFWMYNX_000654 [Candidatus Fervidibacter sp.]|jgi:RNA polymerase sigma factor, sigma-70 family